MSGKFSDLLSGVAALVGIADNGEFERGIRLHVDGVAFTVCDNAASEPGTVLYMGEMCALPGGGLREEVLQGLLEANLHMLGLHSPVFSVDAERRLVLLAGCVPVAAVTAESLLQVLARYAAEAKQWQRSMQAETAWSAVRAPIHPASPTPGSAEPVREARRPSPASSSLFNRR